MTSKNGNEKSTSDGGIAIPGGASCGLKAQAWPPEGLESVRECPVCGSKRRTSVHQNLMDTVFFCAPGSWEMHRCEQCKSCYLDPRPDGRTIHMAYGRYFTHAQVPQSPSALSLSWLGNVRRSWANGYRNWRYGTQAQPASSLGVWAALLIPRLRSAADARMRFIPHNSRGRRLLDVGAGNGAYLLQASSAGWEVTGVEPDAAAVAAARAVGLDVRQGGIEALRSEPGSFDVITMNHVIEHVHDPRTVLKEAFALLRSGGLLFLETPSVSSHGHQRFGRNWRGLEPPRHLVLFNWDSLEQLLREVGFSGIKRIRRSGVYPSIAAKSRAIEEGRDPEGLRNPSRSLLIADTLREFRVFGDYRRAEFITLLAEKQ